MYSLDRAVFWYDSAVGGISTSSVYRLSFRDTKDFTVSGRGVCGIFRPSADRPIGSTLATVDVEAAAFTERRARIRDGTRNDRLENRSFYERREAPNKAAFDPIPR